MGLTCSGKKMFLLWLCGKYVTFVYRGRSFFVMNLLWGIQEGFLKNKEDREPLEVCIYKGFPVVTSPKRKVCPSCQPQKIVSLPQIERLIEWIVHWLPGSTSVPKLLKASPLQQEFLIKKSDIYTGKKTKSSTNDADTTGCLCVEEWKYI